MMTFDRVLPELIRLCREDTASHEAIAQYCIVRDVRGRVRLTVSPKPQAVLSEQALEALEEALIAALGDYFVKPIISPATKGDIKKLVGKILDKQESKWPVGWPRSVRNVLGGGETPIDVGARWTGIERTIGKEAWLTKTPPAPPWPLMKGKTPPIVTFHSFKGGVGRTTLVAAYAILLASRKSAPRIAIVDLDLEAPGVGSLFSVRTERGVLDVLVDHIATGVLNLDDASSLAQVDTSVDSHITVFPAGRIDDGYVQKLARLDFSSAELGKDNPVGMALTAMLNAMKANFDIILLDARAGLHDLAGMSLHGLAHIDVLVFRGTTQNFAGLEQTLRTLGSRDSQQLVLIETLLPAKEEEFDLRRERTRSEVYRMLCEHVYPEDDPPQLGDVGEPHDVVSIRRKDLLDALDSMKDRVAEVVAEVELNEVARRINEECLLDAEGAPEAENEDEE